MVEELLNQASVDRIRQHIRLLEGIRNPTTAPEALERAADYIYSNDTHVLGYGVLEYTFFHDLDEGDPELAYVKYLKHSIRVW